MSQIRSVVIADFHFITRNGLTAAVEQLDGFAICGHAGQISDINILGEKFLPDLMIINLNDDPQLLNEIDTLSTSINPNLLAIVDVDQTFAIRQLVKMGVRGMVTKVCSEDEVITAIQTVSKGDRFYCRRILDIVMEEKAEKGNDTSSPLSTRELEVLKCIIKGLSTNQIAEKLFVSRHTINSHRKNILKKLNLKSPAELIVYALERGITKGV